MRPFARRSPGIQWQRFEQLSEEYQQQSQIACYPGIRYNRRQWANLLCVTSFEDVPGSLVPARGTSTFRIILVTNVVVGLAPTRHLYTVPGGTDLDFVPTCFHLELAEYLV